MNAYAQNASSGGGGGGYASLTSSLLARKGEALPAVDAVAHEGIDIEMRPMQPANSPGAPRKVPEEAIESLYTDNHAPRMQRAVRLVHSSQSSAASRAEAPSRPAVEQPDAWTITTPQRRASDMVAKRTGAPTKRVQPAATGNGDVLSRKAIVTLKMPARDLVRLRLASRDLEMNCQAIILEALECYLDANDVPSATDDEAIKREVERLLSQARMRAKR